MKKLTTNAALLLAEIKKSSIWEERAIYVLFPAPVYSRENAANYWQHEANVYGNTTQRPVNGQNVEFAPNVSTTYADATYAAIKELKAAGLIYAKNHGFNNYSYHAK